MYSNTTSIGLMDEAYFVSKKQILSWIQTTLNIDINCIQDLGTGAVYCQLLDASFSQRVPMHKVNWKAKFEYEFISNLKVFQQSMEKIGISKKVDIQKLAKAKYQDNLELIQWLKRYIELNGISNSQYKAQQRRNHASLYSITQTKKALGNSFKPNSSFMTSSSVLLNSSICSTTMKSKNTTRSRFISNKQNQYGENHKSSSQLNKLSQQMNEIKKILLDCSENTQSKLNDIHKVIFGHQIMVEEINNQMEIEGAECVESEDQYAVI